MVVIVDYDAGNLCSVANALGRVGAEYQITADPQIIKGAERVLLPGVGEASKAMDKLRERGLIETLKGLNQPFLGICLGMQLLCSHSEEGDTECLDILPAKVRLLMKDSDNKVPHIGWNNIENLKSPLFKGIKEGDFVYYVHSFGAEVTSDTICTTQHSELFSGALARDNFYGCQFHPEKSGSVGEQILKNFLTL